MLHAGGVTGQSLGSGCHSPPLGWGWAPGSLQDPPPAPACGPWRKRGALHQTEKRGNVSARRKHGRPQSPWRKSPMGCQHLLQLSRIMGASYPRPPLELKPDLPCGTPRPPLCLSPSQSITLWGFFQPGHPPLAPPSSPGLYQPHQGNGYRNPSAPSQTSGGGRRRSQPLPKGGQSILRHLTEESPAGLSEWLQGAVSTQLLEHKSPGSP